MLEGGINQCWMAGPCWSRPITVLFDVKHRVLGGRARAVVPRQDRRAGRGRGEPGRPRTTGKPAMSIARHDGRDLRSQSGGVRMVEFRVMRMIGSGG